MTRPLTVLLVLVGLATFGLPTVSFTQDKGDKPNEGERLFRAMEKTIKAANALQGGKGGSHVY
jgi:hypothetical protein